MHGQSDISDTSRSERRTPEHEEKHILISLGASEGAGTQTTHLYTTW